MVDYDPRQWFWTADDGRIFSSACQHLVGVEDASYVEFLDNGGTPTIWPRDVEGEQTEASMLAVIEPFGLIVAQSALDAAKQMRVSSLTAVCGLKIVSGFSSDALGATHLYPSNIKDQINLMGSVTDSIMPDLPDDWQTPFWCRDEAGVWGWEMHDAAQIQRVGRDGKGHVVTWQTTLATLNAQIAAAETVEAVDAIGWPE